MPRVLSPSAQEPAACLERTRTGEPGPVKPNAHREGEPPISEGVYTSRNRGAAEDSDMERSHGAKRRHQSEEEQDMRQSSCPVVYSKD